MANRALTARGKTHERKIFENPAVMATLLASKTEAPFARFRDGIARAWDLSISALVNGVRLFILISPIAMSLAQAARAETVETVTVEYAETAEAPVAVLGSFGPFAVVSAEIAQMRGETDASTPGQFRRMLAAWPALKTIRMIDVAGTHNDDANFEVARMIRRAGISTVVPGNGSVRSGGVELFLAGVRRNAEPGAEFGVHSWRGEDGVDARDASANDPAHAAYVRYYQEVGLPAQTAREFYAFTNRVAFADVHYMTRDELARFQITN